MQAPFHALSILNPNMETTEYGSYRDEHSPGIRWAAGLDDKRGVSPGPSAVPLPIAWPAEGDLVALMSHGGRERPDPLPACRGYVAPTGLPILLQLAESPNVTAHAFLGGGVPLEHCVFDETSYTNPIPSEQERGRRVLGGSFRHAVVLIPRDPLSAGETYAVSITSNGVAITWSFTVKAVELPPPPPLFLPPPPTPLPFPAPAIPSTSAPAAAKCLGKTVTRLGTPGSDTLTGTAGPDVILALGGDDRIDGGGGGDLICAGEGSDTLMGGAGNDVLNGEGGVDTVAFPAVRGVNVDLSRGSAFGDGADILSGTENVIGSAGKDNLKGSSNPNVLNGLAGPDALAGRGGNDTLNAGIGRDSVDGGPNRDRCDGGKGIDSVRRCERLSRIP